MKVDKVADNEDDQDVLLSDEDLQEPQRVITEPLEDELMNAAEATEEAPRQEV